MSATFGFWPTRAQQHLLQAALLDGAAARRAYDAWSSDVDLDTLDGGSIRLLPLLFHNLREQGIAPPSPIAGRLRGVYRQSWYKNQLLIGALGDVLDGFARAQIPTMVLKGVPLGLAYYPALATRPIVDVDLLIPAALAVKAYPVALGCGLRPQFPQSDWPPKVTASRSFVHASGWEFDLHTHVMHDCLGGDVDDDLWAAARALMVGTRSTLTLAPEDLVLLVLVHAVRRNPLPPVRWVADVAMILRREATAFDWTRLAAQARARRMSLVVQKALRYLHDQAIVAIPESVLAELAQIRIGLAERAEYRSRMIPGAAGAAASVVSDYFRVRPHDLAWQGALGFVRYVRIRLNARSARSEFNGVSGAGA